MSRYKTIFATVAIEIRCVAPEEYFAKDIPAWVDAELKQNGPIPCEGSGIGEYCRDCRFCDEFKSEVLSS